MEVMSTDPKRRKVEHVTQVCNYDFTFFGPAGGTLPPPEEFVGLIRPLFKKWVFQLEACPTTGKHHYQGRGSLFKKKRHPELCGLLNDTGLRGMDVSESSNHSTHQSEIFYALKYDTRVEGPWSDTTWKPPPYIPIQYRGLLERVYPWQSTVLESRNVFNDRIVNLVVDTAGNNGKSTAASLAALHYGAIDLPPIGDHKELLQVVTDILVAREERHPGLVFVDLPRSVTLDTKRLAPFMVAIEQIKKGHVCDVRNRYREWWFDSPAVWVFVNHPPDLKFMSSDRWKLWRITPLDKSLVPVNRWEYEVMCKKDE